MALLNPEQWSEVQRLFAVAAELPPSRQSAFLAQECPDAALRQEVDSLLGHSGDRLPAAAAAIQWTAQELAGESDPDSRLIGTRLGPYRVEAIVGHGGMGAVYRASRDDAEFHQQVAIKLVRAAAESPSSLSRFRRERQILARLSHPNIARLLDGGSTPEGLPYLVMEFIEGDPITVWAAARSLGVEERLRLFLLVCQAVEFAHRDLVVHRDLKPGNILVTHEGVPKLLDFGIAKILESSAGEETVTRTGMPVMTPEYAAPEQVRGEPVTAAVDVYALGLVLYELLTNAKAQPIPTSNPVVIARVVCHMEPPPPARLSPQLAGDLDNIIRKAIRKEPARRYPTAGSLAHDIERHLEGRPVAARPDTLAYRCAKFARRNRPALSWAAIVFCLTAGLLVSLAALRRAVPRVLQVAQLTQSGRVNMVNGIATDGVHVYYSEGSGAGWWLSQVSVKGGSSSLLPVSPPLPLPDILDISPDRSRLLVASGTNNDANRPLWIVSLPGGAARRLSDVNARTAAWSQDGKRIVFALTSSIFEVSIDGAGLRKIGDVPGLVSYLQTEPAPWPERVRFTVASSVRPSELWEYTPRAGRPHLLFPRWKSGETDGEEGGFWLPSGTHYMFRSRHAQTAAIWAVPENRAFWQPFNRRPVQIYSSPVDFMNITAGPDGKRLYLPAGQERRELMRFDPARGQFVPCIAGAAARWAEFSRDGRWVTYTSFIDGAVWRSRPDGSQRLQLTPSYLSAGLSRWSPDGSRLAFGAQKLGEPAVYVVAASGGIPERVAGGWEPSWSPDGNSLMFGAAPEVQGKQKWVSVINLKTREAKVLKGSEGLARAAWSPDPNYAAASNGTQILLFDFRTEKWSVIAAGHGLGIPFWSQDGKYVYYQDAFEPPDQPIYRIRVSTRKIEKLMSMQQIPQSNVNNYALAGLASGDAPLATVVRHNSDIYALDLDLP